MTTATPANGKNPGEVWTCGSQVAVQPTYQMLQFHDKVDGGFWVKTAKELNSNEVKSAAEAVCSYYLGDVCTLIGEADQQLKMRCIKKLLKMVRMSMRVLISHPQA